MNKTTKTILIILGSLLVLCACTTAALLGTGLWSFGKLAQFADNSTTEKPQEVTQIASEIAEFDLPAGYETQYGMKIADFSMVQYATRDEENYIFLTQFPSGTSISMDEMMRQIERNGRVPNSHRYNMDTALVEQKTITIRSQETKLSISEGTTNEGNPFRLASATFQGNGKRPTLLVFVGSADQWTMQTVEDFISSIR